MRRRMMMSGVQETIPTPYITNGLNAWWDGIWNVKKGVHDSSSRTWKNLLSSNNMTLNGSSSFGDTCLIIPTRNSSDNASMSRIDYPDNNVTLEIVFKAYTNNAQTIFCFDYYNKSGFMGISSRSNNRLSFRQSGPDVPHVYTQPIYCAYDYANDYIYINGEKVTATGSGGSFVNISHWGVSYDARSLYSFSGEIYCIRLYNRVLSSTEINENYLIDKGRYGI